MMRTEDRQRPGYDLYILPGGGTGLGRGGQASLQRHIARDAPLTWPPPRHADSGGGHVRTEIVDSDADSGQLTA